MSPTRQTAFRLPDELMAALQAIKERDGIPLAEQVRRALATWVRERGALAPEVPKTKTARTRVSPRKRA